MKDLQRILESSITGVGKVVDFDSENDRLVHLDCTEGNKSLSNEILTDTQLYSKWVDQELANASALYGIGGYNELRSIYKRSDHFTSNEEPRRLHLGVDIWGKVGTPVYNFYDAKVHSFANNSHFGDYGATIILEYRLNNYTFYLLYGHLNFACLSNLSVGKIIPKGEKFAEFGDENENGSWPPHVHIQLILEMGNNFGDYPGVCKYSEREQYLANCPNPELILRHTFGLIDKASYN